MDLFDFFPVEEQAKYKAQTSTDWKLTMASEIVELARDYIKAVGGFEKFAEWGLF